MAKRQKNSQHKGQKTEEQSTQRPKEEEQSTQWPKDRRTDNTMAKRRSTAIVLTVLRYTDSDYHFGIFKLVVLSNI
jgi:hypothetical protein